MNIRIDGFELKAPYKPRKATKSSRVDVIRNGQVIGSQRSNGPRRRSAKPLNRNKSVKLTIQALKQEHKELMGTFFQEDSLTAKERIHGHPVVGRNGTFFITSIKRDGQKFSVWRYGGYEINLVKGGILTHRGAMDVCDQAANQITKN